MERSFLKFCKNGRMKFPVGFRFEPTNEVLFSHYLKKKVLSEAIKVEVILELDVFKVVPWLFQEDGMFEEQIKRVAGNGHWREDQKRREVVPSEIRGMSGMKSILEFWQGKGAAERKTRWEMHRFSLISASNSTEVSKWAIYRIILKKVVKKGTRGFLKDTSDTR